MRDDLAYWRGRITVEARGNQPEQFINLAYRRNIPLRGMRRVDENTLRFTVPCSAFRRLREPAFRTGTRVKIIKKEGFFLLRRRFQKRLGLWIGLALFMGLVLYSSCFVWQIEVIGCETVSATQVSEDLKELGLCVGCSRHINVQQIENHYLTGNDKLLWMSINIRGTTAFVEVKEKSLTPEVIDESIPTNIYAARDGVILSIMDYGGTRRVQAGDAVLAGDLLVSGDWTDQYGVRRLSHCIASVVAETRYETAVFAPFEEQERIKTGKKRKFFSIFVRNKKISLYFREKIPYNDYDIVETEHPLRIGSFAFPIRLHCTEAFEVETRTAARSLSEARAAALVRLGFYETDTLSGVKIRTRTLSEEQSESGLVVRAQYICEEEIGVSLPIEE